MKKIATYIIITFCAIATSAFSQNIHIRGKATGPGNQPAEAVNVVLHTADSVFVNAGTTDADGRFHLTRIDKGDYILQISGIGYLTAYTTLQGLSADIDLGDITLDDQTVALGDVTVTAAAIVSKSDRKIVFPTPKQLQASTNGINLLQSLMLPRIQVNPLTNSLSLPGNGELQLRLNGVKVSASQIASLQPSDILRIEYFDNPGVRYENAQVVLNYITRKHTSGGVVGVDLTNSPHVVFGEDQVSARMNAGKSEFGFNYSIGTRDFRKSWRTNEETFRFADGTELNRSEVGKPGRYTNQIHIASLNYNYRQPDKYYFNLTLQYEGNLEPHNDYRSDLHIRERPGYLASINDLTDKKTHFPSIDLYYLRQLRRKQTLMFNLVATYIGTDVKARYSETEGDRLLTDIATRIEGRKYSLIGEGLYEKEFGSGRLSGGVKHAQSFSDNIYGGTVNTTTELTQADTYLYAEYAGNIHKFYYTLGAGVSRTWVKQQGERGLDTYNFRPRLSLDYRITDQLSTRLNVKLAEISPSLSQLSAVEQLIDSLQIQRGNPALLPYKQYQADLYVEYRKGLFCGIATAAYYNAHRPVMEATLRQDGHFVKTYQNQKSWEKVNSELTARVGMLWDILQFSLSGGINHYLSVGNDYSHTYTNWYYRAEVMAVYKKWMLLFNIRNNYDNFWGESVEGGENMHMIMAMYKFKNISVGVGAINPFADNYKRTSENRNSYASNKRVSYVNESSRLFLLKFAWNFSFGRSLNQVDKRLNNSDSDNGILNVGK